MQPTQSDLFPAFETVKLFGYEFQLDKQYEYVNTMGISATGVDNLFDKLSIWIQLEQHSNPPKNNSNLFHGSYRAIEQRWRVDYIQDNNPYAEDVVILRAGRQQKIRFSKAIEYFLRDYYEVKISNEQKMELGNLLNRSRTSTYTFAFTNNFTWDAGDYGDSGSCFWQDRANAKDVIRKNNGYAMLVSNKETGKGVGRAWFFPHHKQYPLIVAMFNGYGLMGGLEEMSQIVCDYLNTLAGVRLFVTHRKEMTVNGRTSDLIYINSGNTYVISKQSDNSVHFSDRTLDFRLSYKWAECSHCQKEVGSDEVISTLDGTLFCENCILDMPYTYVDSLGTYVPNERLKWVNKSGMNIPMIQRYTEYRQSPYVMPRANLADNPIGTFYCEWENVLWAKSHALIVNGKFTSPAAFSETKICRACFRRMFIEESFTQSTEVCDNCYGTIPMSPQMSIGSVIDAWMNGKSARNRHNTLFTDGLCLWSSSENGDIVIGWRDPRYNINNSYRYEILTSPESMLERHVLAYAWALPNIHQQHMNRLSAYVNNNVLEVSSLLYDLAYVISEEEKLIAVTNEHLLRAERKSYRANLANR